MINQYSLSSINLTLFAILGLGLVIYRYIYPKKNINLFVLLTLIALLPVWSIFRPGDYQSGDFNIHIYRIMSFYDSLKEGILMPSWAAELNATYGNPLFIFNYSLPYYLISFFHFIGVTFIDGTKLYLGLILYLSGITMYISAKEITKNKLAAFTAAIFYLFNPYHLIDVHFRATPGESTIFLIIPLLFFFITKYRNENKIIYLILNSLLTGIMFLAHPLLAVVFCVVLGFYILFLYISVKKLISAVLPIVSLIIGGVSSVYVWISFIIYSPFMFKFSPANPIFYEFKYLFYAPWRFGFLFQGHNGELAEIIGYTQLLVVVALIILYLKSMIKRPLRNYVLFWISILLLFIFLMNPISSFFWRYFKLFYMLLPYGRLMLVVSFCTSLLAAYFSLVVSGKKHGKIIMYFIIAITIGYTVLNWGHRTLLPEVNDSVLRKNVWQSTVAEGTTAYFLNTKWADINNFWFSELPGRHLEITNGKASVREIKRTSIQHSYIVDAQTPIIIKENTLYFPGWTLKSNGKQIAIYPGIRGVIYAKLPPGLQNVDLTYEDILPYKISKIISVSTFSLLILSLVFLSLPRIKKSRPYS